jgi:predicted phosphoribosyltransferase
MSAMFRRDAIFENRRQAGRQLAEALMRFAGKDTVVLALPRGGVPVAYEVAQALKAPLDAVLVRKIGAPGQPEFGLGAVVDGAVPQIVWNDKVMREVRPSPTYLKTEQQRQLQEIERRRNLYRAGRRAQDIAGKTVVVVDDGIATGGTMRAVLQALSQAGARRLVLAVPVAPREAIEEFQREIDEVVCLAAPEPFYAVGLHYENFDQTSDEEVIELLKRANEANMEKQDDGRG